MRTNAGTVDFSSSFRLDNILEINNFVNKCDIMQYIKKTDL